MSQPSGSLTLRIEYAEGTTDEDSLLDVAFLTSFVQGMAKKDPTIVRATIQLDDEGPTAIVWGRP